MDYKFSYGHFKCPLCNTKNILHSYESTSRCIKCIVCRKSIRKIYHCINWTSISAEYENYKLFIDLKERKYVLVKNSIRLLMGDYSCNMDKEIQDYFLFL